MLIITSGNKNSPFYNQFLQDKYLKKYVKARYDVFTNSGRTHYNGEIESYDSHDDTSFVYFVENEEVVGGRRIILHTPNSGMKLKTEDSVALSIAEVYPNLNTESLTYAELGGLFFHPIIQKQNLSAKMYELTFIMLQQLNCDFFVAEAVPENMDRVIRHAKLNNVKQIVPQPEHKSIDGFGDYRIFMSFKDKTELNLE